MAYPHFVLLYVASPKASVDFYRVLLEREPVDASPTFAMFALNPALMLGLWSREGVQPAPGPGTGGGEVAFSFAAPSDVDGACERWRSLGVRILQEPVDMDFGRTFVGLDPDGHRLRVFSPSGE
jgi:predicted enzyme related to lactoylglutathione lyase